MKKLFCFLLIMIVLISSIVLINPIPVNAISPKVPLDQIGKGNWVTRHIGVTLSGAHWLDPAELDIKLGNDLVYDDHTFWHMDATNYYKKATEICNQMQQINDIKLNPEKIQSYSISPFDYKTYNIVSIVFDKSKYQDEETGKIYAVLHYPVNGNSKRDFICITVTSSVTKESIPVILKELSHDRHVFQSIAYVQFSSHHTTSSDFDYGPVLHVGELDNVTAKFMGQQSRTVQIYPGLWRSSGGVGQTITYNPSMLSSVTKLTCNNDVDNDGICDEWEATGTNPVTVTYNNEIYTGPACGGNGQDSCPSTSYKDVFAMIDYTSGWDPRQLDSSFDSHVKSAFNNQRIHLHIQYATPYSYNGSSVAFPCGGGTSPCGNLVASDFDTIKNNTFAFDSPGNFDAKSQVFHYALFTNVMMNDQTTSGVGENWGNDMMITLGNFSPITSSLVEGTFMHELGHNLNLDHGGPWKIGSTVPPDHGVLCKPNYISVMNYIYQYNLLLGSSWVLDYSQSALGPTSTSSSLVQTGGLNEPQGLVAYNPNGGTLNRYFVFGVPTSVNPSGYHKQMTGGSADWNMADNDGGAKSTAATANVDNFPISPSIGCTDTSGQTINGYKDWNNLQYNFRTGGTFSTGVSLIHKAPDVNTTMVTAMRHAHVLQIADAVNQLNSGDLSSGTNPHDFKEGLNSTVHLAASLSDKGNLTKAIDTLNSMKNSIKSTITASAANMLVLGAIDDVINTFKGDTQMVSVNFDAEYYNITSVSTITVKDSEANSGSGIKHITVQVWSSTDHLGIPVTLTETSPGTGIYKGDVNFVSSASNSEFSSLRVSDGDTINADYDGVFHGYAFIDVPTVSYVNETMTSMTNKTIVNETMPLLTTKQ